jgi:hypothetical protein
MNITPKEKANRLYKLYKSYLPSSLDPDLFKALGQKFALICVDEILKAREARGTGVIFDEEYWREVESELKAIL